MFPELFIAGYPPEDLVLKPAFQAACRAAIEALARETADGGPALAGRHALGRGRQALQRGGAARRRRDRRAALQGRSAELRRVRREARVRARADAGAGEFPRRALGHADLRRHLGRRRSSNAWPRPAPKCWWCRTARLIGGSKGDVRLNIAVARVTEQGLPLVYVNQVGGQDELVFDGVSFGLQRRPLAGLPACRPSRKTSSPRSGSRQRRRPGAAKAGRWSRPSKPISADYAACVLGLRDYVNKNGFPGVVLGLSGGIDSALCAAMAVDALGADRVRCVMLPYRFTSQESLDDAAACAKALGVRYEILPIARGGRRASRRRCSPRFAGLPRDVTEENLQARARGTMLMAISNKFNLMVVTTGNKSEMSVGYATLYGDMNGGFNPIKDLYKTEVFRLARLRNSWKPEGALGPDGVVDSRKHHHAAADRGIAREPEGRGFAAALRRARSDPGAAGRARGADLGHRRRRLRPRHRGAGRAHAQHRRIQAPAGGAGREGDAEEFRPRPPLSDHQPIPRSGHAAAGARCVAGHRQAGARAEAFDF